MDMNVDSKVLKSLASGLKSCRNKMSSASTSMRSYNKSLSSDLEGEQYCFSEEATNKSCTIVDSACDNLTALSNFLEKLSSYVDEYCSCKYDGGKK